MTSVIQIREKLKITIVLHWSAMIKTATSLSMTVQRKSEPENTGRLEQGGPIPEERRLMSRRKILKRSITRESLR